MTTPASPEALAVRLEAEAQECLKSSVGNGEYNAAFHVAYIVLSRLARALTTPPTDGDAAPGNSDA